MILCPSCGAPPEAPDPWKPQREPESTCLPAVCPCRSVHVSPFVHGAHGLCFSWHVAEGDFRFVVLSSPPGPSPIGVYGHGDFLGDLAGVDDWGDMVALASALVVMDT